MASIDNLYDLPKDIKKIINGYYTYFDLEFMNNILSIVNILVTNDILCNDAISHDYSKEYDYEEDEDEEDDKEKIKVFYQLFYDRKLKTKNDKEFIEMLKNYEITCSSINKIVINCNHKIDLKDLDDYKRYSTGIDLNNLKEKSIKIVLAPEDKYFTIYELLKAIHLLYSNITKENRSIIKRAFNYPNSYKVRVFTTIQITDIIPSNNTLILNCNDTHEYGVN